jgi:hypothetical protein
MIILSRNIKSSRAVILSALSSSLSSTESNSTSSSDANNPTENSNSIEDFFDFPEVPLLAQIAGDPNLHEMRKKESVSSISLAKNMLQKSGFLTDRSIQNDYSTSTDEFPEIMKSQEAIIIAKLMGIQNNNNIGQNYNILLVLLKHFNQSN